MKQRTALIVSIATLAVLVLGIGQAYALGITLPGIGSITIGGGGSSAGSSSGSSGTGSTSGSGSSLGSTIDGILNNVIGVTTGGSNSTGSNGNVGSAVNNLLGTVTQTVIPAVLPSSSVSGSASSGGTVAAPLDVSNLLNVTTPGGLSLVYSDGNAQWKSRGLVHVSLSNDTGMEHSMLLTIDDKMLSAQKVFTALGTTQDWSGFHTLGIWILPDTGVARDELRLMISKDATGGDDSQGVYLSLPALTPGVWQYVTLDLSKCPPDVLKSVASYGFAVTALAPHHVHFYPPQLGPGVLHHFHIKLDPVVSAVKGTVSNVHVVAEDQFDNVLSSGSTAYNGVKNVVFSSESTNGKGILPSQALVSVAGKALGATVGLNFTNGVSDLVAVNSPATPALLSLAVTDGTVGSSDGDLSLGVTLGGNSDPSGAVSSATQSVLSIAPMPATINYPELISVTAMDAAGAVRTTGGDIVVATIKGANPVVVPLVDLGTGVYQGIYTPTKVGTDIVSATLNNVAIAKDAEGISDGLINLPVAANAATPTPSSGGGGGFFGGMSGGSGGTDSGGITLSDGRTCQLYMTKYIKFGENNDPTEVKKLQTFLQQYDFGKNVTVTGIYDATTLQAAKSFQEKYVRNVLTPWGSGQATGYVYILTLRQINILHCMQTSGATDNAQVTKMVAMKATSCPYFTAAATKGAKGLEVSKAQQFLKDMGVLSPGAQLGTYGDATMTAIKKFQAAYMEGVAPATGNWGPQTMKMANQLLGCATN